MVSHDRYLLERVTDQQYAVLGGHLRHLPGGVDEYMKLRAAGTGGGTASAAAAASAGRPDTAGSSAVAAASGLRPAGTAAAPTLSGAERRVVEKEMSALDRRISKLALDRKKRLEAFGAHDQSDYEGLGKLQAELTALDAEVEQLEERWLEVAEQLGV